MIIAHDAELFELLIAAKDTNIHQKSDGSVHVQITPAKIVPYMLEAIKNQLKDARQRSLPHRVLTLNRILAQWEKIQAGQRGNSNGLWASNRPSKLPYHSNKNNLLAVSYIVIVYFLYRLIKTT